MPWSCQYVADDRQNPTQAPFDPRDTQFSVFELKEATKRLPIAPTHSHSDSDENSPWSAQELANSVLSPLTHPGRCLSSPTPSPTTAGLTWDVEVALGTVPDVALFLERLGQSSSNKIASTAGNATSLYPTPSSHQGGGAWYKGRFLAPSHWINYAHKSTRVVQIVQTHEANHHSASSGDVVAPWTFRSCRSISQTAKLREAIACRHRHLQSIKDVIPNKPTTDRLVQAYLRTFQTVFEILQVQPFRNEYKTFWSAPEQARDSFGIMLLLVISIGSVFCPGEPGAAINRASACGWMHAASSWLHSSSNKKPCSNLETLRIHCLMWLARCVHADNPDVIWKASATLVRMATSMGLHLDSGEKDPDRESRRRIWATVMEMEVQSSMDCGGLPSIDRDDFDHALPSNIDESTTTNREARPLDQFTQASFQILLMKTLPIRLQILRFINGASSSNTTRPTFDAALGFSSQLQAELKVCSDLIEGYRMSTAPPTTFQTQLFELFTQRFLLGLHQRFALKAISEPLYYYSRKTCLNRSMALLSHLPHSTDTDFGRLCLVANGVIFDVYTESALILAGELTEQEAGADKYEYLGATNLVQNEMRKGIHRYLELAAARIAAGEKNIKRYILVACLLAQADANAQSNGGGGGGGGEHGALSGVSVPEADERISTELRSRLHECMSLLHSYLETLPPPPPPLESSSSPFDDMDILGDTAAGGNDQVDFQF